MDNKFKLLEQEEKLDKEQIRKSLTYSQDVWRRLRKNKLAVGGLIGVILILLVNIIWSFIKWIQI